MIRFFKTSILLLFMALVACTPSNKSDKKDDSTQLDAVKVQYARGFSIQHFDAYTKIVVRNPWDTTKVLETYLLVPREKDVPADLPEGMVVKVPVERVGLCSSIFAGEYKQLGAMDKIVAVSEPQYFDFPEVKEGLKSGKITDLGVTATLNTEKVLSSKLDILVLSPFEVSVNDRFKQNGIVVVKDASYMEDSPLGRAEWILFEAAFLDKIEEAQVLFDGVAKRYNDLVKLIPADKKRPTVFADKKYADSWYTAGANSYMGCFYKDAGADYVFSDLRNAGSVPLNFEKVFQRAYEADFWLFKYNDTQADMTLKMLGKEYELYKNFEAYKKQQVFAVNSGTTAYYEEGPLEPDVVLADLIAIFHPDLLPNHQAKYYKRLNRE